MSWYKVALPAEDVGPVISKSTRLENAFMTLLMAYKIPHDAALFTEPDERLANHYYYFSPDAAVMAPELVKQYDGIPCSPPKLSDRLTLLCGHSDAKERLLKSDGGS